jgi:hypothetical protein
MPLSRRSATAACESRAPADERAYRPAGHLPPSTDPALVTRAHAASPSRPAQPLSPLSWHGLGVRIATWNVNSVKSRLPRLLPWLADRSPDVLLLQETKSTDEAWPATTFTALGYDSGTSGPGAGTGWRCCPVSASNT